MSKDPTPEPKASECPLMLCAEIAKRCTRSHDCRALSEKKSKEDRRT